MALTSLSSLKPLHFPHGCNLSPRQPPSLPHMHKHIRRISVALGVNKVSETQDDAPTTLSQFLSASKERYLSDIRGSPSRGGEWTVVMGNEAGGAYISPRSL